LIGCDDVEKLPQRMSDVLKTIGENAVLFRLYVLLVEYPEWDVYQNLSDKGCDLVLINSSNNNKIKIEVKTRQKLHTTSKNSKTNVHFTLSKNEYEACDFLIGYWFELNRYYIVPKNELSETKSNQDLLFKYVTSKNTINNPYLDNWNLILEKMAELK
jgi:hypothetical protein